MQFRGSCRHGPGARFGADRRHRRGEPVPPLRHGFDVQPALRRIAQRLAKGEHVVGEIRFLDEGIRPDLVQQFVFGNEAPGLLDQRRQEVERLRGQRHGLTVSLQHPLPDVDQERPELVVALALHAALQRCWWTSDLKVSPTRRAAVNQIVICAASKGSGSPTPRLAPCGPAWWQAISSR